MIASGSFSEPKIAKNAPKTILRELCEFHTGICDI